MIFRLSLFCCGLGHNTWEKRVSSGLKSISVRGEAIALLLISEGKGGYAQASVKEVWVGEDEKELVHFLPQYSQGSLVASSRTNSDYHAGNIVG